MQLLRLPNRGVLYLHRSKHGECRRSVDKCQLRCLGVPHFRLFIRAPGIWVHLHRRGHFHHRCPHGSLFRAILGTGKLVPRGLLLPARYPPCAGTATLPGWSCAGGTPTARHHASFRAASSDAISFSACAPQCGAQTAHLHHADARGRQWRDYSPTRVFGAASRRRNLSTERLCALPETRRCLSSARHSRASAHGRNPPKRWYFYHADADSGSRFRHEQTGILHDPGTRFLRQCQHPKTRRCLSATNTDYSLITGQ